MKLVYDKAKGQLYLEVTTASSQVVRIPVNPAKPALTALREAFVSMKQQGG
jgi:hypothetical protein